MDTLRGGAILLMLFWHATSLPHLRGVSVPPVMLAVNEFFLPFRMPTLMFLSGLLLPRSLAKPMATYARGKVAMIAWPWLIWMVVYRIADGSTWALAHPTTYIGRGYLWFLFFLCVYYAVAPLVRRLPPGLPALLLWIAALAVPVNGELINRLLYFAVYFFVGAWVAQRGLGFLGRLVQPRWAVPLGTTAVALGIVSVVGDITYNAWFVPASLAGIVSAVAAAGAVPARWTRPFRFVGRNSIVYYVSHFPLMVGALWLMLDARWHGVWCVVALMALGVAAGTGLAHARHLPGIWWLFEMPLVRSRPRRETA